MATPHVPGAGRVRLDSQRRLCPLDAQRHVEAEVRACLLSASYPELRRVTGDFHEGILTLRGHVSSFYLKQVAQTLVQQVEGVERVVNRVEVTVSASAS